MVEVQEVTVPRSGGASRAADFNLATREWIGSSPLALSEARRAGNRDRIGLFSQLRCECTRPNCTETLPAVAETHRRAADQLIVAPAHFDGGVVARCADQFFVIESLGDAILNSRFV